MATVPDTQRLHLYSDLAGWWPLVSAPEEYAEEAEFAWTLLGEAVDREVWSMLELGSGGGNLASHLKRNAAMTLVDVSNPMLELSRRLNPDCKHVTGDMRSIRLGRFFDAVLIHDAIGYMTTDADLRAALETAFSHCRPGGAALFMPDCVSESFTSVAEHGGHDAEGRGLRYLEWRWDPDPTDTTYTVEMIYALREGDVTPRIVQDRHILGLFSRETWLELLGAVGFDARPVDDRWGRVVFVGKRRS
jgi:SAM-dependent methyltransferase